MKSSTMPQTEEQKAMFQKDYPLISAFVILGWLSQFWSGASEYIGFKGYIQKVIINYVPFDYVEVVSNALSWGLAITLEVAVYAGVTYMVNCWYDGYLTFDKKDLSVAEIAIKKKIIRANRFKYATAMSVLLGIVIVSFFVSKKNVRYETQASAPDAQIESTIEFTELEAKAIAKIETRYNEDKESEEDSYKENKKVTGRSYDSKVAAKQRQIKTYQQRAFREGTSFFTKISKLEEEIATIKEERTTALLAIKEQSDDDLSALKTVRDVAMEAVKKDIGGDKKSVQVKNDKKEAATEARNNWLSYFLETFAGLSVFVFLGTRTWVCVAYNTAGIKPQVFVKKEYFESGMIADLFTLLYTYPKRSLHNKIRRRLTQLPELKSLKTDGVVMNYSLEGDDELPPNNPSPTPPPTAPKPTKKSQQKIPFWKRFFGRKEAPVNNSQQPESQQNEAPPEAPIIVDEKAVNKDAIFVDLPSEGSGQQSTNEAENRVANRDVADSAFVDRQQSTNDGQQGKGQQKDASSQQKKSTNDGQQKGVNGQQKKSTKKSQQSTKKVVKKAPLKSTKKAASMADLRAKKIDIKYSNETISVLFDGKPYTKLQINKGKKQYTSWLKQLNIEMNKGLSVEDAEKKTGRKLKTVQNALLKWNYLHGEMVGWEKKNPLQSIVLRPTTAKTVAM